MMEDDLDFEPLKRMSRDLVKASHLLTEREAKFLVDAYYMMQRQRIRAAHQTNTLHESDEPATALEWMTGQSAVLEKQVARALKAYASSQPLGQWAQSIVGIGPVITAGLLAHIDLKIADTAGKLFSFAGLEPNQHARWTKGQKRPWNAALKRLCFLIGESFVKHSGREGEFYGTIYNEKKRYYIDRNERGLYAARAAEILAKKNFRADTKARAAYEAGRLPDGHIHMMAKRYAVKMFLSHYHEVGRNLLGLPVVAPFAIGVLKHDEAHYVQPPNWPMQSDHDDAAISCD